MQVFTGRGAVGRVSTRSHLGYCALGRVGVGRCFGWLGRFLGVAQLGRAESGFMGDGV